MSRVSPLLSTFNGGEWSPSLYGRTDLARYANACKRMENFIPLVQGAATRRPGTRYVAPTKGDGTVRLIPFEFSITQAYVIEFGAGYVRFYTNDGQLLSGGSPYEVSTPYTANDIWDLQFAQSADVLYIAHPDRKSTRLNSSHT